VGILHTATLLLRVSGSHRIRCCSSSPSQRPTDLLPLHRLVSLRRLQRCRVHRTSPLMRRANPKHLNTVFFLTFRLTRCRTSRYLSTNSSALLIGFSAAVSSLVSVPWPGELSPISPVRDFGFATEKFGFLLP
jgi:hypothetical protein